MVIPAVSVWPPVEDYRVVVLDAAVCANTNAVGAFIPFINRPLILFSYVIVDIDFTVPTTMVDHV